MLIISRQLNKLHERRRVRRSSLSSLSLSSALSPSLSFLPSHAPVHLYRLMSENRLGADTN